MSSVDASSAFALPVDTRNPRRRQRKDSDEIVVLRQQPQRKRSKLSRDSSKPSLDIGNEEPTRSNGHIGGNLEVKPPAVQLQNIPVRERRQTHAQRIAKADGSTILTKNANYAIKQLPSFPNQLRTQAYRGTISASTPFALATTSENAFIWDYASTAPSPSPWILQLPDFSRPSDPLPLGALVSNSASRELGLVVVAPVSGKILFWEDVDHAQIATLFRQRRDGREGSVNLYGGETVVDLVDVGHAGFVVVSSSGRMIHLTLRDGQGRPAVSVQTLRNAVGGAGGGFFGGLKNVFGVTGWRKEVAAVKSRPSVTRGQIEMVAVTEAAVFQFWDLDWSGQSTFKGEADASQVIELAIKQQHSFEMQSLTQESKVLDLAILPTKRAKGNEITLVGAPQSLHVLALVASYSSISVRYALLEIELESAAATVERVLPLDTYSAPLTRDANGKPKLLLPGPGHTALVVFDRALTIVTIAVKEQVNTPNLQLMVDSNTLPEPFQDTIWFRNDDDLRVVGCSAEVSIENSRQSSCVIFIKGYGLVRFIAEDPLHGKRTVEQQRVTAKSKIEQAVLYSTVPNNILDFSKKSEFSFPLEDVERGAMEISNKVLRSESAAFSLVTASMDQQLRQRETTMRTLAEHLRANYPPLPRVTKWRLLLNAEKLSSARAIWKWHDAQMKEKGIGHRTVFTDIVDMLHERYKTEIIPELGETDPVRHWFIKDVWRIETIVPWTPNILKELYTDGARDEETVARHVSEADDIALAALETAFNFRAENAELYGLADEPLEDGILNSDTAYKGLAEFWSSTYNIVHSLTQLATLSRKFSRKFHERRNPDDPALGITRKIFGENPRLVDLCCKVHMERYRWLLAQDNEIDRTTGATLRGAYDDIRREQIMQLAEIGMASQGMGLAEKLRDMRTLAALVVGESQDLLAQIVPGMSTEERTMVNDSMRALEARVRRYFDIFGEEWANAAYTNHIENGRLAGLLDDNAAFQTFVTEFLRSGRKYAKLSWINDVVGEKDFASASQTLFVVATANETNLWNKKVELSLAKLSLLAKNDEGSGASRLDLDKASIDRQLEIAVIQERLYDHVKVSLYGAIDQRAEFDFAIEAYAKDNTRELPALQQLLVHGLEGLINHQALDVDQLIDVLTLMDHKPNPDPPDNICQLEFFLALGVLRASGLEEENRTKYEALLKLIWRRCLIRDKWEEINNTHLKSDAHLKEDMETTTLFKTLKECTATDMWTAPRPVKALGPNQLLDIDEEVAFLEQRFPSEDLRIPIAKDIKMEAKLIRHLYEKCRLEDWWKDLQVMATERVAELKELQAEKERVQRAKAKDLDAESVDEASVDGEVIASIEVVRSEGDGDMADASE